MRENRNRFQRGSGAYKCRVCGKMTRETGDGESFVMLCRACYWKSGVENAITDGGYVCTCENSEDFTLDSDHEEVTCKKCGRTGAYDKWE